MIKKSMLIVVQFILFVFVSWSQLPKLYINFVSHNEENYSYLINPVDFYSMRPRLIQMAQLTTIKGAKWHLGSDHIMLRAVLEHDTGSVQNNTNNQNVLRFISSSFVNNVECDPHAHESLYNNVDVAYLHDSLGVNPGVVMSGFLYDQLQSGHDWQDYQNPVAGEMFPNYTWAPEIIWGAATPGHTNDPDDFGIWKPQSMTSFFSHDDSKHLINYGQGCKILVKDTSNISYIMDQVRYIVNAIQTGSAPSNGFYCTSIFFSENNLSSPNFISLKMDNLMDSINVLVAQNKVEWMFIPDIVENWKNVYNEQAFIMDCDLTVVSSVPDKQIQPNNWGLTPNPSGDQTSFWTSLEMNNAKLSIYNSLGEKQKTIEGINGKSILIQKENLPNGIYFVHVEQDNYKLITEKLVFTE